MLGDISSAEGADPTTKLIREVTETMGGEIGDDGAAAGIPAEDSRLEETGYIYSRRAVDAIRAVRDEQRMSARELSQACEILSEEAGVRHTLTRARLSKLENGITSGGLTVDELIIASRALGVSVSTLLGDAIMRLDEQQAAEELRQLHTRLGAVLRNLPGWTPEDE